MTNRTDEWLRQRGQGHLADAAMAGQFSYGTAFSSAVDQRPLASRLADFDARMKAFKARVF